MWQCQQLWNILKTHNHQWSMEGKGFELTHFWKHSVNCQFLKIQPRTCADIFLQLCIDSYTTHDVAQWETDKMNTKKKPTHTIIIYLYSRLSHKGFKVVSKRHAVQKDTNEHLKGLVQREKTTGNNIRQGIGSYIVATI